MPERPESTGVNDPSYWDALYRQGEAGWDMGSPTPVFGELLTSGRMSPGSTLVLGCGKGHDAVLFARHGFPVTAVDFSPEALRHARALAARSGVDIRLVQEDLFHLSGRFPRQFDYVVEYVTFCAIDPARRGEFAAVVHSILRNDGRLVALFFPLDEREGGPPFAVSREEIRDLFGRRFTLEHEEAPAASVKPRRGRELLMIWRKNSEGGE